MWIGTYFGGVNYYPRQYTYFDKVYPQKESNKMGKRVREFCAAHDGTLWIGTEDKGLFHYYPSTGKIEPFIHPDIYHNVHGLYLDGDYLWVGNFAKGLKRIDLRTYAVKHYDNIASDIFSICRITAGDLYLGTTIGLFRYNPDTERFKRVPELGWTFVYYIKEDKQGNLWLATYADGVYKKNVRTGGWEHFVHEEADSSTLPSNKVLSILKTVKISYGLPHKEVASAALCLPPTPLSVMTVSVCQATSFIGLKKMKRDCSGFQPIKGWCILTRRIPVLKCIQLLMGC